MTNQSSVNPVESLAFSIHAQPGVYALLLGSGVSRAAGIPTGWDVLGQLIRKLAKSRGFDPPTNPVDWYRENCGADANYSQMLGDLGTTPADRKSILQNYFEPTQEEREQSLKQPTEAHSAIAELVAHGYIRVIVTTNFDRLIENALIEAGVEPVVLSTDEDFANAEPLAHMRCCVIKLHGDYLDPDTLNTEEELKNYDDEKRLFLERAIADYGLVVCGWSADWDEALREALVSNVSRHYSTYWHVFGEASDFSEHCINSRSARKIEWGTADELFSRLRDHVLALEEYTQHPPENDELAVATFKRLLSENRYRIRLHDYIKDIVEEVSEASFRITPPSLIKNAPNRETVEPKLEELESVSSKLVNCAFIAGQWFEPEHLDMWHLAFQRLINCETAPYSVSEWHHLREFPAMMTLHALCMGATVKRRYNMLGELLHLTIDQVPFADNRIAHIPEYVHSRLDRHFTPTFALHERVYETMRGMVLDGDYFTDRFSSLFSEAEILQVLAQAPFDKEVSTRVPLGRFMAYDQESSDIIEKIRSSIDSLGSGSPYVSSAIFGDTPERCLEHVDDLAERLPMIRQQLRFQRYNLAT